MSCKVATKIKKDKVFDSLGNDDFTKSLRKAMNLFSINSKNVHIYGSYNFRAQTFPGDIDMFEMVLSCKGCDLEQAQKNAVIMIQNFIKKVKKNKNVYLGDFKIGQDEEYYKIIEKFLDRNDDEWTYTSILEVFKKFYDNKIISYSDFKKYCEQFGNKKGRATIKDDAEFYEILRNLSLLRWTPEEVLKGVKKLNGRNITLFDAVKSCYVKKETSDNVMSLIKPDLWVKVDNKFIEISNLLIFYYEDKKGKNHYFSFDRFRNLNSEKKITEAMINGLKTEVALYYYSPLEKFQKPIKYAKRIFSLSLIYDDRVTAQKLIHLWRSPMNLLYQIKAEFGTLRDLLSNVKKPPTKEIKKQIDETKTKISRIIDIDINSDIFKNIDTIVYKSPSKDKIIELLKKIDKDLKALIDPATIKYLKKVGLYPAPKKYLSIKNYYLYY